MTRETQPQLSLVILCYKSGNFIRTIASRAIQLLESENIDYQLILVANYRKEDALSDLTPSLAKEIAKENPRVLALTKEKEGMFGWDVKSGLNATTGELISFIDGDGQMPIEDTVRLYKKIKETKVDMAQTFRVKRFDGMERIFVSRVYNFLLRLLFPKVRIFDANAKPKMFTRHAYEKFDLQSDDWFIDAEMVIQATEMGLKIEQIPTVFLKNPERKSFVRAKDILQFLQNLIRYRFFRPAPERVSL